MTALFSIPAGLGFKRIIRSCQSGGIWCESIYSHYLAYIGGYGVAAIFASLSTPIFSMLQAVGRVDLPVKLLCVGLGLKIGLNYVLTGIPEINILGAGIGTLVCYVFITISACYFLCKETKNTLEISLYFYKTGHCFHVLLHSGIFFPAFAMSKIMPDSLATGIAVFIAVFIYIASLLCLKALCKDDVLMLPKGQKLVKYLKNITLSCKISQCKHNLLQKESGLDFQQKECYTIGDLEHIIALLRAPGGCPWDIEQTHQSVRANLIEETYEAVEAIDTNNMELLKEELGDVFNASAVSCTDGGRTGNVYVLPMWWTA